MTTKNQTKERQEWMRKREELERRERRVLEEVEKAMETQTIFIERKNRRQQQEQEQEIEMEKRREWKRRISEIRKVISIVVVSIGAKRVDEVKPQIERFEQLFERSKDDLKREWIEMIRQQQLIEDELESTMKFFIISQSSSSSISEKQSKPTSTRKRTRQHRS